MAMLILEDCTACDLCRPDCPTQAISEGDPIYIIDPNKCDECQSRVDLPNEPHCVEVCPVDCIIKRPDGQ